MRISYHYGKPVSWKQRELIPVSQSFVLGREKLPFGLAWNRPAGIIIRDEHGTEQWLQIRDMTRRAQIVFLMMTIVTMLLVRRGSKR